MFEFLFAFRALIELKAQTSALAIDVNCTRVCSATAIGTPFVLGATVLDVSAAPVHQSNAGLDYCDVNVTLTHGLAKDRVRVSIWLPMNTWNGRYMATGGGGFAAGLFEEYQVPAIAHGYAASSTDAGSNENGYSNGSQLVGKPQLVRNFAYVSMHDMAVVSKSVIHSFYGRPAHHSYWNGCSTGGRQGMIEAQLHPEDFDGILANAPAISFNSFVPADLYPFVVMQREGEIVPGCVFDAITQYAIDECDGADGVMDRIITDPATCTFDATSIIGRNTMCNGIEHGFITAKQARIYNLILRGPIREDGSRLWYGLMQGADLKSIATVPPFAISASWCGDFVLDDPDLDLRSLSYADIEKCVNLGQRRYSPIDSSDPDLSAFRDRGGKIISWHGLADDVIFPQGTFHYKNQVNDQMGGAAAVDEFFRVFAAPAVGHCFGGSGPVPDADFDALVSWVEHDVAPEVLTASYVLENTIVERNLCRYPKKLKFEGGDFNLAASWSCEERYSTPSA